MPGHVFIMQGDILRLACDAWLLPTDRKLFIESAWRTAASPGVHDRGVLDLEPPAGWGSGVRTFRADRWWSGKGPATWITDVGGHGRTPVAWFVEGAVDFVRRAANVPDGSGYGRDRPLLALPLVGTGAGGGARRKGEVVRALVPALTEVASRENVDVALVTHGDEAFAAAQWARRQLHAEGTLPAWPQLRPELINAAGRLAEEAILGQLVLFLGAGVSAGAGLPLWQQLLKALAAEVGFEPKKIQRLSKLDVLDQARLLEGRFPSRRTFGEKVAQLVEGSRYALAHGLLASLPVREIVTVNYDCLFEQAASAAGRPASVLPYQPAAPGMRWLLKLHGTVDEPQDIVLTRSDYLRYADRRAALAGIVQALLITRHMLFVGFSLNDDNFHRIAEDVRRAVAPGKRENHRFGTAVLLHDDELMRELWQQDLECLAMEGPAASVQPAAARCLEIFLDCLLAGASTNAAHLLDGDYGALLSSEEQELRRLLGELMANASPDLRTSTAWAPIERLLKGFGRSS